MDEIKWQLN